MSGTEQRRLGSKSITPAFTERQKNPLKEQNTNKHKDKHETIQETDSPEHKHSEQTPLHRQVSNMADSKERDTSPKTPTTPLRPRMKITSKRRSSKSINGQSLADKIIQRSHTGNQEKSQPTTGHESGREERKSTILSLRNTVSHRIVT